MTAGAPAPPLDRYDTFVVDIDGVVLRGTTAIVGSAAALEAVRSSGRRVVFVTNNAVRRAPDVAALLAGVHVSASADDVVTSADATATLLAERLPQGSSVLVVGSDGLHDALRLSGLRPVTTADPLPAAVVQGLAPHATYDLLAEATLAVRAGVPWYATNVDATLPAERGELPGNGALVSLVRTAAGGAEPMVVGKPGPHLLLEAARRTGAQRPLMVGDRLDTDIAGAKAAGFDSLLVLSGADQRHALVTAPPAARPEHLASSLHAAVTGAPEPWTAVLRAAWERVDSGQVVAADEVLAGLPAPYQAH